MSIRVSVVDVKKIIDLDDSVTNQRVEAFIIAANRVIEDQLLSSGIDEDTLMELERWLTAHLLTVLDPRLKSTETGEAKDEFMAPRLGLGLDASIYGQQVKILDPTNSLSNVGKRLASLEALV